MYPFTVSEHGFDLNELLQALQTNVQAVIITPRSQNPTGYSLDTVQAEKIYKILEDYPHVLVIVDDHFSLLAQAQYQHIIPPPQRGTGHSFVQYRNIYLLISVLHLYVATLKLQKNYILS